ncbi:filamin-A [Scaptodrosophila lebanonensis]|uniref:Filamin-A n=1 Tax=Drosophila lebanonensis TaxID=7225 RepID=A0A6J2T7X1_DROLE|nr:filamin-A [Scaptodrosophila lebanonensis]
MFRVSQEIHLNTNASGAAAGHGAVVGGAPSGTGGSGDVLAGAAESACIFGKYQRMPEADAYPTEPPRVYIAPELTDPSKVQLLRFPSGAVRKNSTISFIVKRNGVKGNFDVRLESPGGTHSLPLPLSHLDPERFEVECQLPQAGLYKVHIKCNSVPLPKSPFIIVSMGGPDSPTETATSVANMLSFKSDATKVQSRGLGLTHISLSERNEFTVDGSTAGNNMLFVGILGPQGPCDEVLVKHMGRNIYRVVYNVHDPGDYVLAAKWGDDHIPGSPFCLSAE